MSLGLYMTSWAQPMPPSPSPKDVTLLVAHDAEFIQKTLDKANLEKDKKSQRKMRLSALMIAHYAQSAIQKDDPKNLVLATLRDQALAVHKAVEEGKFADAKKLAGNLSLKIAADPKAKLESPALIKIEEFENIMSQFSSARLGGFGMEDMLDELGMLKDNPNDAEAIKIYTYARKVSMIATLTQTHTPAMLGGAKTIEAWKGFAGEMHKDALNLAKAAETKKAIDITKVAQKLADSCKSCHDVFR